MIYMDNAASTRTSERVREAMKAVGYGNASSVHPIGAGAWQELEQSRNLIGITLGCGTDRIMFTSGATEANNAALNHYAVEGKARGKKHIVVSAIEHPSVYEFCKMLRDQCGFRMTVLLPRASGAVSAKDVERAIQSDTCMVCVMAVNNETGVIQPYKEIARICERYGVPYHCDATQGIGLLCRLEEIPKASVSFSAHKFHGPKGVGCLILPEGQSRFHSYLIGGYQESGRRAGTENVEGIVGMSVALEESMWEDHTESLRKRFYSGLKRSVKGFKFNGDPKISVPNIINVSFDGVKGEELVSMLSHVYGICCSTGSACCSGSASPSRVLKSMGISDSQSFGAIRISTSRYTTEDEIDTLVESIRLSVEQLRKRGRF